MHTMRGTYVCRMVEVQHERKVEKQGRNVWSRASYRMVAWVERMACVCHGQNQRSWLPASFDPYYSCIALPPHIHFCFFTSNAVAASNDSTCDNGLTGVQDPDTDVCCPLICGDACGGEGCGSIAGASSGDCCAADIMAAGVLCSDSGSAPCLITPGGYRVLFDNIEGYTCLAVNSMFRD